MNYHVTHRTEYLYDEPVTSCYNEARLLPRSFARQTCTHSRLIIDPLPNDYREREDFFGNRVAYFTIQGGHTRLCVTAESDIQIHSLNAQLDYFSDSPWETVCAQLATRLNTTSLDTTSLEARQYALNSPMVAVSPELENYARASFTENRPLIEAVHELMARIHHDFVYDPSFTTIATPLSSVLKHRRGVCQDFAHLAIGCLRSLGLAARYVSGYIETLPPPGCARLIGADASHAWFSVFVPEYGWLDLDPTNNQMPMDKHVTVAWGRDFSDITPLKGVVFGAGEHQLKVSVDVAPI